MRYTEYIRLINQNNMAEMQRIPQELINIQKQIMEQAEKQGFIITKVEALRIIAKSYKAK